MRKMSIAIIMAVVCMLGGINAASAASYTISWKNNMNMFTYSNNADAVCSNIKTAVYFGAAVMDQKTISSLAAEAQSSVTVSSPMCSHILLSATCMFRDHDGKTKTETKNKQVMCWGGETYMSPAPMNQDWTTFEINYYCTPPCK